MDASMASFLLLRCTDPKIGLSARGEGPDLETIAAVVLYIVARKR